MARTWRIAKKFRLSLGEFWVRKDLFDQLRPIVLYFADHHATPTFGNTIAFLKFGTPGSL